MTSIYLLSLIFFLSIVFFILGFVLGNKDILPRTYTGFSLNSNYKSLNGRWYLYWLSFIPNNDSPVWLHGICDLQVNGKYAIGKVRLINHPSGNVHFLQKGEFRDKKLILADVCIENDNEFATIIYSNLANSDCIIGIWNGLDNLGSPIAGPNVMSRQQLSSEDLNQLVQQENIRLIPPGKYEGGG
jgi:hypothetical protein